MRPLHQMITRLQGAALLAVAAIAALIAGLQGRADSAEAAPQFTQRSADAWINSAPLRIESFRGRVLLIDVWTFDCWNCYRSIPWIADLEKRFGPNGLSVLGIHSPEFDHERQRERVVAKVREFGIRHPVMLDNDFAYWRALDNQYWPAFYVIDKKGVIRGRFVGETHIGDRRATEIERLIGTLIGE